MNELSAEITLRLDRPMRLAEASHVARQVLGEGALEVWLATGTTLRLTCTLPKGYDLNAQEGRAVDLGVSVDRVETELMGRPRH